MLFSMLCCIAYILGIIWGLNLQYVGLIPFLFILLGCILYFNSNYKKDLRIIICFVFVMVGVFNTMLKQDIFDNKYTEGIYYGKGKILELLSNDSYYNKYLFKLDNGDKMLLYIVNDLIIEENTIIDFSAQYKKPSVQRNKGGFNYSYYLYSQNIYGSLYIKSQNDFEIIEKKDDLISIIREKIFITLGKLLPKDHVGILLGMIIGDTFYISQDIKESFKLSGISHLLAVSGTNITYIIITTKFIFNKIFGKSISNYFSIITIVIFILIAGTSPSVVRAGIMAIILIISEVFSKEPCTLSTVSVTCLLMLLYNPYIICDVGFLLSFGGTIGIVLLYKKIKSKFESLNNLLNVKNKIIFIIEDVISLSASAQIIIIPVMAYYFNSISIISLLTNILVYPFVGFITIGGIATFLIGLIFFPFAKIISFSIYVLISILICIAKLCSLLPFANFLIITPNILIIFVYYIIVLIFMSNNGTEEKYKKYYELLKILALCMLLFCVIISIIPNSYVEVNFVDVGQGDCTHIKTKHGLNILIDGGGSEQNDYDVGSNILIPYLLDNTNGIIDYMIVSHFHEDHVEGLISVLQKLKVRKIIIGCQPILTELYNQLLNIAKENGVPIYTLYANNEFIVDDVHFKILFPKKNLEINDDLNNNSLILKCEIFETSILFTGDAEIKEEELLLNYNNVLDVDILKVGHHGSKTSSSEELLLATTPLISIISCGLNNKFGHPHQIVLDRINNYSKKVFRTDLCGEIMLKIYNNHKIIINTMLNN